MYELDGIVYAGEPIKPIKVISVRLLENYKLLLKFATGEVKIYDVLPLLNKPVFALLKDEDIFKSVYVESGTAVWNDGDIDIAPETLFIDGITIKDNKG